MSRISYSAVVLDEQSRNRLINYLNIKKIIPDDWEVIAHHMTINMGELSPDKVKFLGMSVKLQATDIAGDDKVIAVGVSGFESNNSKPHITVAVNRANGGKPVMSNQLTDWKPIKTPLLLSGKVTEVPYKL